MNLDIDRGDSMNLDIDIGTQFTKRSKANKGRVYTVVDELTTTNRAGAIVKVEFLCTHEFCGQQVKSRECATTIKMGLRAEKGESCE